MYGAVGMEPEKEPAPEEQHQLLNRGIRKPEFLQDLDPIDPTFWTDVTKVSRAKREADTDRAVSWNKCLDEVRCARIKNKYDTFNETTLEGTDPVILMVTDWYDQFKQYEKELFPSFEKQISKLAEIFIDQEYSRAEREHNDSRYTKRIIKHGDVEKTLLHVAAERNLVLIAECLLKYDPDMVYRGTRGGHEKHLPIELSLKKIRDGNIDNIEAIDDTASLLINKMLNKKRVRMLFEYDYESAEPPRFSFKMLVQNDKMQKTVMAVLDSLINPDWPYIPVKEEADKEWHSVPDMPIRYHFYYRILDGDDQGRAPKYTDRSGNEVPDNDFKYSSTSCLQELCQSEHKKAAIRHPVIHFLGCRKWDNFGKYMIWCYCLLYMFFLFVLSCSLLGAVHSPDPTKYRTTLDHLRGVCEIITILISIFHVITEIDQMVREGRRYIHDKYNWMDVGGVLGIFAIMALRFVQSPVQWHVAAIVFIINCFRVLKFFPAWQMVGLYSKILLNLIWKDMRMFLVVYFLVMFAFSGGTYLSFRATTKYNMTTGFASAQVKGFGDILLRGVRALAEGEGFADSYDDFNAYPVILILLNMFIIMVFLVNILIAQLSANYEDAQKEAELEYKIDKTMFVSHLENSLISCLGKTNPRVKYYREGEFVNKGSEIKEVLAGWKSLHPDEKNESASIESQMVELRKMLNEIKSTLKDARVIDK